MTRPLLVAALVLFAVTSAVAAPLAPSKPSDIRGIFADDQTPCSGGNGRVVTKTYDALGQVIPFTIPAKQVLVVTQIDWYVDSAAPSQTATLSFTMFPAGGFSPTLMIDGATADGTGRIRKTTLTSPLIVPSGAVMCVRSSSGTHGAFVHGFLTKAK